MRKQNILMTDIKNIPAEVNSTGVPKIYKKNNNIQKSFQALLFKKVKNLIFVLGVPKVLLEGVN